MPSAPLESTLRAYNPDEDPLAGYDAGLLEAKTAKLAKQDDILKTLGGETRTTVNFAVSRDAAALVAAAGAAVNTALVNIPRSTVVRPVVSPLAVNFAASQDVTKTAAATGLAAGAAVNTALVNIPRAGMAKLQAGTPGVGPDGTVVTRGRQVTPPDVETQNVKVRHLEQRILGLTNHIVSGNAAEALQTARPSLRGGIWH